MAIEVGNRFTRLVVIEFIGYEGGSNHKKWKCRCDCGRDFVARNDKLLSGRTKSCGCLRDEISADAHAKKVAMELPEWEKQKAEIAICLRELRRALLVAERLKSKSIATRLKEGPGTGFSKAEGLPNQELRHFHREGSPSVIAAEFKTWAEVVLEILRDGAGRQDQIGLDVYFYRKPNPSLNGPKDETNERHTERIRILGSTESLGDDTPKRSAESVLQRSPEDAYRQRDPGTGSASDARL